MNRNIYLHAFTFIGLLMLSAHEKSYAQPDSVLSYSFSSEYFAEAVLLEDRNKQIETAYMGWLLFHNRLQWRNHGLQVDFQVTHGDEPAVEETMDLQVFSNIEAGYLYGIFEMYYEYDQENFWLKLGQQDINTDFMKSENGLHFVHSSFGIDPLTPTNLPGPTFPFVSLAATAEYVASNHLLFRAGAFDGQFARPRGDYLPISWKLSRNEGYLFVLEPELNLWNDRLQLMPGALFHSGSFITTGQPDNKTNYLQYYIVADFALIPQMPNNGSFNIFLQASASPSNVGVFSEYLGGGFLWKNTLPWKIENNLGIAFAHAQGVENYLVPQGELKYENALELSWKFQVKEWLHFKPYFMWLQQRAGDQTATIGKIAAMRAVLEF